MATKQTEGSGVHGRLDPALLDRANIAYWRAVAVAAEAGGLANAARHLHHYLDNSGSDLWLDLDLLEATCPVFARNVQDARGLAAEEARAHLDASGSAAPIRWVGDPVEYSGADSYFTKGECADWFYAVGGNTHRAQVECVFVPGGADGGGTIEISLTWSFFDRYNWDGGKAVTIAGVTVNDEVLGRLHAVGLAREFDIKGERTEEFSLAVGEHGSMDPIAVGSRVGSREYPDVASRERR